MTAPSPTVAAIACAATIVVFVAAFVIERRWLS